MQQYEYKFRWLNDKDPLIVDVEKTIYASDLTDAKRQVKEEWPELDPDKAHIERIKGNGEADLPLSGA